MQEKMYRIFISSTYVDLIDERKALIQAVLQLGHYPICMESFVATHEHQMNFIKEQLDNADMYIIILGKRYGTSIDNDKCSYTEREYEYAKQIGLPILAFVSSDNYNPTANWCEEDKNEEYAINKFRNKLKTEKHLEFWDSTLDLISKSTTSLQKLIDKNLDGWIKEPKYLIIRRKELNEKIDNLQSALYSINFNAVNLDKDILINHCKELIDIYHELQIIGFSPCDRVHFKRIDYLFNYIITKTEDFKLNIKVLYWYAKFLNDLYEIHKALDILMIYISQIKDDFEKSSVCNFLGLLYWKLKDYPNAESYLDQSLNYLATYHRTNKESLLNTFLHSRNNETIEESLKILCEINNVLGLCSDNKEDFGTAITYYKKATEITDELIKLNKEKYLFKHHLYIFNTASAQYKELENKNALNNVADYNIALNDVNKALAILEKLQKSANVVLRLSRSYQLRGDILSKLNKKQEAFSEYNKSVDLYKEYIRNKESKIYLYLNNYKNDVSWCYHKLAEVYLKIKQYDRSISSLKKAIGYREELLISSIGYEHNEHLLNLAESELKISEILFEYYHKDEDRNRSLLNDAYHYADNAFYCFEQLFDSNIAIYRKRYIKAIDMNLKICIALENKNKVDFYKRKLKMVA